MHASSPPAWLLHLLETALNGVLQQQQALSSELWHKQIHIHLQGLNWEFKLEAGPGGMRLKPTDEQSPDLHISASPGALLQLAQGHWVQGPELQLHGDIVLARQIQAQVQSWELDWEEWLARALGDVPAYHFSNQLRAGFAYTRQSIQSLQQNTGEYLQYEARALPDQHTVNVFLHEIDNLRDAVDRLEARILRLQRNLS